MNQYLNDEENLYPQIEPSQEEDVLSRYFRQSAPSEFVTPSEAQQIANQSALASRIGGGLATIGSSLGYQKPDTRFYENLAAEAQTIPAQAMAQQRLLQDYFVKRAMAGERATLEREKLAQQRALTEQAIAQRQQAAEESRLAREAASRESRLGRQELQMQKAQEKQQLQQQKTLESVQEVEERKNNINDAIQSLISKIEDKGLWQPFGSHNQDIDRLVSFIATDAAKLVDPKSVARPEEVKQVEKNLISSGFQNTPKTAIQILKNFQSELQNRTKRAYEVRKLPYQEAMPNQPAPMVQTFENKRTGEKRNKISYDNGKTWSWQ